VRVRRIRIRNYGSYRVCELDIPDGITGAIGRNGSGKTTILEALAWALFGKGRNDRELTRCAYAPGDEPCEVEAEIEIGDRRCRLLRALVRRGKRWFPEARLDWGSGVVEGAAPVTAEVQRLLGMDAPTFFRSVFARQGELDALSDIDPRDREQHFLRMLGIDRIDAAVKQARDEAAAREREVAVAVTAKPDPAALEAERAAVVADLERIAARLAALALERREADADLAAREAAVAELRRKQAARAGLDRERARLGERLGLLDVTMARLDRDRAECARAADQLRERQPALDELARLRAEAAALEPLLRGWQDRRLLESQAAEAGRALADLDGRLAGLAPVEDERRRATEREAALRAAVEAARQEIGGLESREAALRGRAGACEAQARQLADRRAGVASLGPDSPCPACTRPLGDELGHVLGHLEEERQKVEDGRDALLREAGAVATDLAERRARLDAATRERDAVTAALRGLADRAATLKALRDQRAGLEARRADLDRRLGAAGPIDVDPARLDAVRARLRELEPVDREAASLAERGRRVPALALDLAAARAEADAARAAFGETARAAADLGFEPEALAATERALVDRRGARERLLLDHRTLEGERNLRAARREALDREIAREKALAERIAALGRDARTYKALESLLRDFRRALTERVRPAISARASRLLARATGGRYDRIELQPDYQIRCHDAGEPRELAWFSGGESDLIHLCLRIAVSEVVAEGSGGRLHFIALDEVFGSQDRRRRDEILRALREIGKDFVQIFLITHDEGLKDHLENVIEVTRGDDGVSRAALAR
jgi:DNA repair protein SbcC/Rad50